MSARPVENARDNRKYNHYMSIGCPRNKQTKISVQTETNRKISVSVVFPFVSWNPKKISVCFGLFRFVSEFRTYIKTTETNRTVSSQTETNRNNPKFSEKSKNMLSIKLFWLVFCLCRFIRNIETLCFGIEAKQPKQTVLKQTKTSRKKRNNPKFFSSIETPKLSVCRGGYFLLPNRE